MILTMMFLLATGGAPAMQDKPSPSSDTQSVNGGKPQNVRDATRSKERAGKEHIDDGMNSKRAPDPRPRDAYGTPTVTPPPGQGTDNAGGLPAAADPLKSKK